MSVSYGGDSITFADGSVQSGGWTGMRNRIINGAMMIDQRNAGAAVTSHATFPVDRFRMLTTAGGTISGQQVSDAPTGTGFKYSTKITITTAATPSGGVTGLNQNIEGYNVVDFKMGSSDSVNFTISFWVKSSVTGTYGMSIMNGAANRFYLTTYIINLANTWEYKTITVPGDTSGTWYADNQGGIRVDFDLGSQSSNRGSTINSWHTSATYFQGPSGGTNLLSTLNATWQLTGLQLERGSTASSFEYRPYGTELALCQRYYYRIKSDGTATAPPVGFGSFASTTNASAFVQLPVSMRIPPSSVGASSSTALTASDWVTPLTSSAVAISGTNQTTFNGVDIALTVAGATQYRPCIINLNGVSAWIDFGAEL